MPPRIGDRSCLRQPWLPWCAARRPRGGHSTRGPRRIRLDAIFWLAFASSEQSGVDLSGFDLWIPMHAWTSDQDTVQRAVDATCVHHRARCRARIGVRCRWCCPAMRTTHGEVCDDDLLACSMSRHAVRLADHSRRDGHLEWTVARDRDRSGCDAGIGGSDPVEAVNRMRGVAAGVGSDWPISTKQVSVCRPGIGGTGRFDLVGLQGCVVADRMLDIGVLWWIYTIWPDPQLQGLQEACRKPGLQRTLLPVAW